MVRDLSGSAVVSTVSPGADQQLYVFYVFTTNIGQTLVLDAHYIYIIIYIIIILIINIIIINNNNNEYNDNNNNNNNKYNNNKYNNNK